MTQTSKEIIEYLEKRYQINISTTNYLIQKIDSAIESAYLSGTLENDRPLTPDWSNGCDCGQMNCTICHG